MKTTLLVVVFVALLVVSGCESSTKSENLVQQPVSDYDVEEIGSSLNEVGDDVNLESFDEIDQEFQELDTVLAE